MSPSRPLPAAPKWLRRVIDVVTRVELGIAGLGVAMIFVLVLVQAAQRYLPFAGWSWTGELARFCLVWVTFTAAGVLVTRDKHISLQLVDTLHSTLVRRTVRTFACLVVAATGLGFAIEAWSLIQSQSVIKSPAMRMPMSWLYVLPFVGFVSTTIRGVVAAGAAALLPLEDDPDSGEQDDGEAAVVTE